MKKELNFFIEEALQKNKTIKFDISPVTKGYRLELEIGNKKNIDCGPIYGELLEWMGYGEFMDFVLSNTSFGNFHGEFVKENNEIFIYLTLEAYDLFEEEEEIYISLNEELFKKGLNIDLASIGIDDFFEEDNFILDFSKEKDKPIEDLALYYFDENKTLIDSKYNSPYIDSYHLLELNEKQKEYLISFIEKEIDSQLPDFCVGFECEIKWNVSSQGKILDYYLYTSPIKIEYRDFIEAKD